MPTIVPAVATPTAGETIQFKCEGAATWRTEPKIVPGTTQSSAGQLTYAAPIAITSVDRFTVIAEDTNGKELDQAVVLLRPQISPAVATPGAGETIQFKCDGAASWRTEPQNISGIPSVPSGIGSFAYRAPMPIIFAENFEVVALDAKGGELNRAIVHLLPTQLKVQPAKVEELRADDSIRFSVEPVELLPQVTWSSSDDEVKITGAGVLKAPTSVGTSRNITVTATWESRGKGERLHGAATVRLSDHIFKVRFAAGYSLCFIIGLLGVLVWLVTADSLDGKKSRLNVVPPAVTLRPDDTHQFQARLSCASNVNENTILWQATAGTITNGFYRATVGQEPPATVTITAINKAGPCDTAVATVFLSATGRLEIVPPFLRLSEFQSYQFDVATQPGGSNYLNYNWRISPEQGAGTLTGDGLYMSPPAPSPVRYARIIAQSKTDPRIQAAALVELSCTSGCGGSNTLHQIFFILVLGALGSTIHCMRSLGDYVGNQKFAPSWFLFYIFKPFIGATLAYIIVSQGALKADGGSLSIGWGALAALVGLFSEQAMGKLGEIATTLFGRSVKPASDDGRGNKLDGNTRPTVPADGSPVLRTSALSKDTLILTGEQFAADCKIKIGDELRDDTKFEAPNTLKLVLTKSDLAQKSLNVSVVNKSKQSSTVMDVPIP